MTRERLGWLVVLGLVVALVTWIARNTYWTDIKVPTPLTGEAATDPFYVLERFSRALGARAQWNRESSLPPANGVIFLSGVNWDLSPERRQRIEHWVESGGRLVVDGSLLDATDSFEEWSGIRREPGKAPANTEPFVRKRVGHGSVTAVNGRPFDGRTLFEGENGSLFVSATQLRRGDVIHFFTESDQASLLTLAWQFGWPVICLAGLALALGIWRSSVRFGPLAPPTETARRSLAEQIRGTGQFTMRIGSTGALHTAAARALNEAAARYINAYERLPGAERMQALAKVTGYEPDSLAAALHYSGSGRPEHLRSALELLEAARRRILLKYSRF